MPAVLNYTGYKLIVQITQDSPLNLSDLQLLRFPSEMNQLKTYNLFLFLGDVIIVNYRNKSHL